MSLCEKNCELKKYYSITKKAICDCQIKITFQLFSEIMNNKDKLLDNILNFSKFSNILSMKCYKQVFSINGIKTILVFIFLEYFSY